MEKAKKQSERIIDGLSNIVRLTHEVKGLVEKEYRKHEYESIFLQNPNSETVDKIKLYGGVVVDEDLEEGVLFSVPHEWVLNTNKQLHTCLFEGLSEPWIRLVIPDRKPIIIYTRNTQEVKIYDGYEMRVGYTHVAQSSIELHFGIFE